MTKAQAREIADLVALMLQAAQAGDAELAQALCWTVGRSLREAQDPETALVVYQKKRPPRP